MPSSMTDSSSYEGPKVYPQAATLAVLAFTAFFISSQALLLQLKHHNLAVTILLLSMTLANIQNMVNPIIWPNDDVSTWFSGHIVCDIESKLQVGLSMSIPASAACICQRLASVLSPNNATAVCHSARNRRFRLVFDLVLCVFLPLYAMSIHIVVQPARYYIYGISGCQYSLSKSWVTVPLLLVWPMLSGLLGTAYAVVVLFRMHRHRREVSSLLQNAQTNRGRFLRVFVLAATVSVVSAPTAVYIYVRSLDGSRDGWTWNSVHPHGWASLIYMVPSGGVVWFDRWLQVVGGFVVFGVFGLGSDARAMYRQWLIRFRLDKVINAAKRLKTERGRSEKVERGSSQIQLVDMHHVGDGRLCPHGATDTITTETSLDMEEQAKTSKEVEVDMRL